MKRILVTALAIALAIMVVGLVPASAATAADVLVKKAIADSMTPEQLAAYKNLMAARINAGAFDHPRGGSSDAPGDTCTAATPEIANLGAPFNGADTTVGATDNFDLPPDVAAPTCTASTTCTGAGPAGSLPRGAIYTGTGTGPDRAYHLVVDTACTLSITMDPTSTQDLALIIYQSVCSNNLADCVCVDDTGVGGVAENVVLSAVPGLDFFAVTDGYSTGGTPPGPSGPYTMNVTRTAGTCNLVPVELIDFTIG